MYIDWCCSVMAPERPGGEDQPVPVALSATNSITIPITLLSIPKDLLHIKVTLTMS